MARDARLCMQILGLLALWSFTSPSRNGAVTVVLQGLHGLCEELRQYHAAVSTTRFLPSSHNAALLQQLAVCCAEELNRTFQRRYSKFLMVVDGRRVFRSLNNALSCSGRELAIR